MNTVFALFWFEMQDQMRRGINYVLFTILFAIAFGITAFFGSSLQSLLGQDVPTLANAPYLVGMLTIILTTIAIIGLAGSLFGQCATKDFEADFYALLVTCGVNENEFIIGRLFAAWLTAAIVLLSIPLGLIAAIFLPTNVTQNLAPFQIESYLYAYGFYALSNVLVFGVCLFGIALITRRTIWSYLLTPLLPTIVSILLTPLSWLGLEKVAEALDLFGASELGNAMQWTIVERNTTLLPVSAELIFNRIFWIAVTVLLVWLLIMYYRFSQPPFELESLPILRKIKALRNLQKTPTQEITAAVISSKLTQTEAPVVTIQQGWQAHFRQLTEKTHFEFSQIAGKGWLWVVIIGAALFSIASSVGGLDQEYGVSSYPTTGRLLANNEIFVSIVALLLIFFLGESIWRERECHIDGLIDSLPTPNMVLMLGKLLAVILIQLLVMGIFILVCILVQISQAYFNFELGLYLQSVFTLTFVRLLLFMVLAQFIYVLANQKFIGHFINLIIFIGLPLIESVFSNSFTKMLFFGYTPIPVYSDLSGYAHYLAAVRWYQLYWGLLAVLLLMLAQAFWQRGGETNFRQRIHVARAYLQGSTFLLFGGLFLIVGAWIFYNTQILYKTAEDLATEEYKDQSTQEAQQAAVKQYLEKCKTLPQPSLSAVSMDVDFYPRQRTMRNIIQYTLQNQTQQAVHQVIVNDVAFPALTEYAINGEKRKATSTEKVAMRRVSYFELPQPLNPGEQLTLSFVYQPTPSAAFADSPKDYAWVENGSMISSDSYLPAIGCLTYLEEIFNKTAKADEVQEKPPSEKEKPHSDIGEVDFLAQTDDLSKARQNPAAGLSGKLLPFEGTICTDSDHTAFLPGDLINEEEHDNRRCFTYHTSAPILMQFFIVSGHYLRAAETHNGINLEIFYHPTHAYNLSSIFDAMKTTLELNSAAYAPYPYTQLRVVEIPSYINAAISTPGTIVFGEEMGMLSRVPRTQTGVVDYPYFVISHETSHQWWGEQLIPARAEGLHVILETLTQYSAVKSVDKFYGVESVRNFLKFEHKKYMEGRLNHRDVALARVTGANDDYIYYRKGAVVMYTLRDYLGAKQLDNQLHQFFTDYLHGPPFALSQDLMKYLRRASTPQNHTILTDLLETITIWDLNIEKAQYKQTVDGKYEVTLTIRARKARADALGSETPIPMKDDLIDIGLLGIKGNFIYLQKHPLNSGANTVQVVLDEIPIQAGVDPVFKLMDRVLNNNLILVTPASQTNYQ